MSKFEKLKIIWNWNSTFKIFQKYIYYLKMANIYKLQTYWIQISSLWDCYFFNWNNKSKIILSKTGVKKIPSFFYSVFQQLFTARKKITENIKNIKMTIIRYKLDNSKHSTHKNIRVLFRTIIVYTSTETQ